MSATQQLILRVTEELAQQIRVVVEQHSDVSEQTPLIVEIEPEIESGRRLWDHRYPKKEIILNPVNTIGTSSEPAEDCFSFIFNNVKYPALVSVNQSYIV